MAADSRLGQDPDSASGHAQFVRTSGSTPPAPPAPNKKATDSRRASATAGLSPVATAAPRTPVQDQRLHVPSARELVQAGQPLVIRSTTQPGCTPRTSATTPTCRRLCGRTTRTCPGAGNTNVVPSGPGEHQWYGTSGAGQDQQRWHPLVLVTERARRGATSTTRATSSTSLTLAVERHRQHDCHARSRPHASTYFRGINQPMRCCSIRQPVERRGVREELLPPMVTVCRSPQTGCKSRPHLLQVKTNSDTSGLTAAGGTYQTWASLGTAAGSVGNSNAGTNRYALRRAGSRSGTRARCRTALVASISATCRSMPTQALARRRPSTSPSPPTAGSGRTLA